MIFHFPQSPPHLNSITAKVSYFRGYHLPLQFGPYPRYLVSTASNSLFVPPPQSTRALLFLIIFFPPPLNQYPHAPTTHTFSSTFGPHPLTSPSSSHVSSSSGTKLQSSIPGSKTLRHTQRPNRAPYARVLQLNQGPYDGGPNREGGGVGGNPWKFAFKRTRNKRVGPKVVGETAAPYTPKSKLYPTVRGEGVPLPSGWSYCFSWAPTRFKLGPIS